MNIQSQRYNITKLDPNLLKTPQNPILTAIQEANRMHLKIEHLQTSTIKTIKKIKRNIYNQALDNRKQRKSKGLPRGDHGDGCTGNGHRIRKIQCARRTCSRARQAAPGTDRRLPILTATWNLQCKSKNQNPQSKKEKNPNFHRNETGAESEWERDGPSRPVSVSGSEVGPSIE